MESSTYMTSTKVVSPYTMFYYLTCKQGNSSTYVDFYNTVVFNFQWRDPGPSVCSLIFYLEMISEEKSTLNIRNPTIFNRIRWFTRSLGQMTHRPSIWCSKYHFFFHNFLQNSLQKLFLFIFLFFIIQKK